MNYSTSNSRLSPLHLVALVLFALGMSGCQPQRDDSTPISVTGHRAGFTAQQLATTSGTQLAGVVGADANYQEQFNDAVRSFMSSSVQDESYVGYVSARAQDGTGVFFGGKVTFANGGSLRTTTSGQIAVAQNSFIDVFVKDTFPGQTVTPLPHVYFPRAEGYVSGTTAQIRFSDDYGYVELRGQFDSNVFYGQFLYRNVRDYQGNEVYGQDAVLGDFQIPTCQFFNCN